MGLSLLVGNGINRISDDVSSWTEVLNSLVSGGESPCKLQHLKHKPFALVYEEILLTGPSSDKVYDERKMKEKIAEVVGCLEFNGLRSRVMSSGVRHVLTTNYDYFFEKATGSLGERRNLVCETKYSAIRRRLVGNTYVWHIHGEAESPTSITLGYDQYSGYLQKLRTYATADCFFAGDSSRDRPTTRARSSGSRSWTQPDNSVRDGYPIALIVNARQRPFSKKCLTARTF